MATGRRHCGAGGGINGGNVAGKSKKGYAPYNPQKKNQDSLVMREEAKTGSLMLGVLDGHGEHGDLVSQYFRDRLPDLIFSDRHYPQRMEKAMVSHFDGLEQRLLDEPAINTEFSGTTAVVGVIHEDVLKVANIGDSRLIIGKLARDNSQRAGQLSQMKRDATTDYVARGYIVPPPPALGAGEPPAGAPAEPEKKKGFFGF